MVAAPAMPVLANRWAENAQLEAAIAAQYDTKELTALEPGIIKGSYGRAARDGSALTLRISHGRPLILTDDQSGCGTGADQVDESKCFEFTLAADLPSRHAFIVCEGHYEGSNVLLIDDRTGQLEILSTIPRFSADNTRLLVISNDESRDAGLIEIWRRDGAPVTPEWALTTEAASIGHYLTEFIRWDRAGIQLDLTNPATGKEPEQHHPALLVRHKSGWRLSFQQTSAH
jgi:hypothetical protein